jgi:hypothetical protein
MKICQHKQVAVAHSQWQHQVEVEVVDLQEVVVVEAVPLVEEDMARQQPLPH